MSKPPGEFGPLLKRLAAGHRLAATEAEDAFAAMMDGSVSDVRMAAFLTALQLRGATITEITGAARAMRAAMTKVAAPAGAIDVCGTGGDGAGTLNVSTAAAFVVAGLGVPVAKHGNRAMSSSTGAADVLETLGIPIDNGADAAAQSLAACGFTFLFAPLYHPAMKHVTPVRRELGFRTVFNLLGPLCNPAGVRRQLLGIYSEEWLEPVAHVLSDLGTEKAWVVHGADGLDEMTTTGVTRVAVLEKGRVHRLDIAPEDAGLKRTGLASLQGGARDENARALRELLQGGDGAYRDIVCLNAGAALVVADRAADIAEGVKLAAGSIDSGAARRVMERARTGAKAGIP
jgi:anthranilate phosphoribosyltransferase